MDNKNLIIGQGFACLEFGSSVKKTKEIFGEPSEENDEEEDGLVIKTLTYDDILTDFCFQKNLENNQYVLVEIISENPDFQLENGIKLGMTKQEINSKIKGFLTEPLEEQDEELTFVQYDEGVTLIYTEDILTCLEIAMMLDQEGNPIIPE